MKKILIALLVVVLVVAIAAGIFLRFFLNDAVKKGIESQGPKVTQVNVNVASVGVSLLSGSGEITGLVIGNPPGCKTPSAIKADKISISLQPSSVLSKKVIIRTLVIESPEITWEGGTDSSNITKIQENIQQALGASDPNSQAHMQVDDFVIRGGKINVALSMLGGKGTTIPLPEIHLQNLGNTPEGMTASDLSKEVVGAVVKESTKSVVANAAKLGLETLTSASALGGETTKEATDKVGEAVKGVTDLFK